MHFPIAKKSSVVHVSWQMRLQGTPPKCPVSVDVLHEGVHEVWLVSPHEKKRIVVSGKSWNECDEKLRSLGYLLQRITTGVPVWVAERFQGFTRASFIRARKIQSFPLTTPAFAPRANEPNETTETHEKNDETHTDSIDVPDAYFASARSHVG